MGAGQEAPGPDGLPPQMRRPHHTSALRAWRKRSGAEQRCEEGQSLCKERSGKSERLTEGRCVRRTGPDDQAKETGAADRREKPRSE